MCPPTLSWSLLHRICKSNPWFPTLTAQSDNFLDMENSVLLIMPTRKYPRNTQTPTPRHWFQPRHFFNEIYEYKQWTTSAGMAFNHNRICQGYTDILCDHGSLLFWIILANSQDDSSQFSTRNRYCKMICKEFDTQCILLLFKILRCKWLNTAPVMYYHRLVNFFL